MDVEEDRHASYNNPATTTFAPGPAFDEYDPNPYTQSYDPNTGYQGYPQQAYSQHGYPPQDPQFAQDQYAQQQGYNAPYLDYNAQQQDFNDQQQEYGAYYANPHSPHPHDYFETPQAYPQYTQQMTVEPLIIASQIQPPIGQLGVMNEKIAPITSTSSRPPPTPGFFAFWDKHGRFHQGLTELSGNGRVIYGGVFDETGNFHFGAIGEYAPVVVTQDMMAQRGVKRSVSGVSVSTASTRPTRKISLREPAEQMVNVDRSRDLGLLTPGGERELGPLTGVADGGTPVSGRTMEYTGSLDVLDSFADEGEGSRNR
jgi:hypothetical protein